MYSTTLPELPVPTKNAQGVILAGNLYIGGGHTGNCKTDATVYVYDITSCKWTQLPSPSPTKWSGMAVHKDKVILVGGRETQCHGTDLVSYTNKIAVWNESDGGGKWENSLPRMSVPRLSPVVISHQGSLIVAGGKKGSLDFHVEVLGANAERWMCGAPLPLPCFSHTSTVVGGEWYLMEQQTGVVRHASISSYLAMAMGKSVQSGQLGVHPAPNHSHSSKKSASHKSPTTSSLGVASPPPLTRTPSLSSFWKSLPNKPPQIPFKIASANSQLLALSSSSSDHGPNVTVHVYQDELWAEVDGRFPHTLSNGLLLGGQNGLYILGGQVSHHYASTAHQLTFTTLYELRVIKKSRQLRLFSE